MDIPAAIPTPAVERARPSFRRRSQRIPLIMPLEASGQDAKGENFKLTTTATNLNRNGATLHLNRDLSNRQHNRAAKWPW